MQRHSEVVEVVDEDILAAEEEDEEEALGVLAWALTQRDLLQSMSKEHLD